MDLACAIQSNLGKIHQVNFVDLQVTLVSTGSTPEVDVGHAEITFNLYFPPLHF